MASAGGNFVLDKGFDAVEALSKYRGVVLTATGVEEVDGEGDVIIGVTQFAVSAAELALGKGASVRLAGISLVEVGSGGVTAGTIVVSDATGKAIASNSGARPLGIALQTKVEGNYVSVFLTPGLPVVP